MSHRKGHKKSSSFKKSKENRQRANKNRGPGTDKVKKKDRSCKKCKRMFKRQENRQDRADRRRTRMSDRTERKQERRDKRLERKNKATSASITPALAEYTDKSKNPRFL